MFKCFCWLFWSSETDFLNIYWSKAIDITRKKKKKLERVLKSTVIFGPELFLRPHNVMHALLAQEEHLRAQIRICRAKQTRKSSFEKWLAFFLHMLKPSSPEEPWR